MPGHSAAGDWGHDAIGQGTQRLPGHHQGLGESGAWNGSCFNAVRGYVGQPVNPRLPDSKLQVNWFQLSQGVVLGYIATRKRHKAHTCLHGTQILLGFTSSLLSLRLCTVSHAIQPEHVASWLRQMPLKWRKVSISLFLICLKSFKVCKCSSPRLLNFLNIWTHFFF